MRVEEIKLFIKRRGFFGQPEVARSSRGKLSQTPYVGRQGIVAFRNFCGRGNQGDHIDLWWSAFMAGFRSHPDYFSRSQEIWFWDIS